MYGEGYIKLFRGLQDSQVFAHPIALKIWIWCLMKANHKERFINLKTGKGSVVVKVGVGQFIFGRHKAEEELDIDGATIYRWINKFASEQFDNMISLDVSSQYTIVTICKWEEYQSDKDTECTTNEQPLNNQCTTIEQPMSTNKNDNNDKNVKNNNTSKAEISLAEIKAKKESDFRLRVSEFKSQYSAEMIKSFCDYWTESGEKSKQLRYEKQEVFDIARRLATWKSKEKPVKFGTPQPETSVNKKWGRE